MAWRSLVLGYHGCDKTLVREIVSGQGELRPSRNDYDWLGEGSYFWEDSYDRAHRWAAKEKRTKPTAA